MKRLSRRSVSYIISALMTGVFLYLAFRGTNFTDVYRSMLAADYWWILLMIVILMVSNYLRAWRWRYLLDPLKRNIGMRNLFSAVMIGYLMNNVLPRAGELARPYSIGKLERISKSAALGTIVVERIMDTVSLLLLIVALPIVYRGSLKDSFPWLEETAVITAAATGIAIAILVFLVIRRDIAMKVVRVFTRIMPDRLRARVEEYSHLFLDGFLFMKEPRSYLMIFVSSLLIWVLYVAMMYVAFGAFGLFGSLGLRAAFVVLTTSTIGTMLPTPGATGTYHFFVTVTLTKMFNIPNDVALSYSTVTHAAMFIGSTLVGVYYLFTDQIQIADAVTRSVAGAREKA